MAICIVKATRSQNPEPNHCAASAGPAPLATAAANTISTAHSARANASGNQRSNQSESLRPIAANRPLAGAALLPTLIWRRLYAKWKKWNKWKEVEEVEAGKLASGRAQVVKWAGGRRASADR